MRPRKSFVDPPDPRPCHGCNWCGQGRSEVEETLCPACMLLKDDGWFKWNDEVSKKVNFTKKSNEMNCPSIRAFLEKTTVKITEKLKKMSLEEEKAFFSNLYEIEDVVEGDGTPEDRPRFLRPKKKKQSFTPTTKRKQSVTPTTGGQFHVKIDSTKGDTIEFPPSELADAIKSKLARRCQDLDKDVITSQCRHLHLFVERKASVCSLDPRPSFGCGWCGVTIDQANLCFICESFKDFGCSMRQYSTSVVFCSPTTKLVKGVKEYLSKSTNVVAEAVKLLSASDRALLREKYQQSDEFISTFTHRRASKGKKKVTPREALNKSDKKRKLAEETSITSTKKSDGVTPSRSRSKLPHVTKARDARVKNGVAPPIIQVSLPTIPQLLEISLSEVLKADVFCVYNYHFGTNSNIAAKILLVLSEG